MKRRSWSIAAVAAATTTAAGVVIATSSAGGTGPSSGAVSALTSAAPTQVDERTVNALDDAGFVAKRDGAVSVTASDGTQFRIVPGVDGGACLVSADGSATCGEAKTLTHTAIVGISLDEKAADSMFGSIDPNEIRPGVVQEATKAARGGTISLRGIAADDVESIAVIKASGDVLGSTSVKNNVFTLGGIPFAKAADVRVTRHDGGTSYQSLD